MNEFLWLTQMSISVILVVYLGKKHSYYLKESLILLPIAMNLHVTKIITLWGKNIACGDILAITYGLGINIIAQQRGLQEAQELLYSSLRCLLVWSLITFMHTSFYPLANHEISFMHQVLLGQTTWICLSSWMSFFISQHTERYIFRKMIAKYSFTISNAISSLCSQILDTVIFTYVGLYHSIIDPYSLIMWSLWIKSIGWIISVIGVKIFYENNFKRWISF